jgi:predicted acyltransferase (DUF342 family)
LREKLDSFESLKSQSDFTVINNAEFAPEIANEFVTIFYDDNIEGHLSRSDAIDFT